MLEKWIELRARLQPEKTALFQGRTAYSYKDLRERIQKASNYLTTGTSLKKGDRVAILSQNCATFVDLLFACSRTGLILVPLNWRLAPEELKYQVRDAAPSVLLYSSQFEETAEAILEDSETCRKVSLTHYEELLAEAHTLPGEKEGDWEDPVAILYTGGTTGTPKGAVLSQRMILWNAMNTCASWGLSPEDIAPIFTPMFHTGGLNVLLTPLLSIGGTVVIPDAFDPESALGIIEDHRCTVVFMIPTMFQMMADSPSFKDADFSSVRFMIAGGAPCPNTLYRTYFEKGVTFIQGYGLTEAGPNNFAFPHEKARDKVGAIGIPSQYVEIRLEPQGAETGEIWIRGPHVFSHYWRKPTETGQVFEDGWLKTGDLASVDEEGFYRIMGRRKEMYISGGENVYPVEVEYALSLHPSVKEAAVIGVPDSKWGEVGKAYIVARNGNKITGELLCEHLREKLARYKIPKQWEFREDLPKTPAGKVLKNALK
ncbi:MAG: long-chain fatty acid--CoA ligase [Armatimonadetes bacterium]|nr:long-chain fatty acid--CoA ligase [Armatimonadota bacterium]